MSTPLRSFVIVNRRSAAGRTGTTWSQTEKILRAKLGDFEYAFTEAPGHATSLARRALEQDHELVVAVGGDGTLNEVLNGFFNGRVAVRPSAALGMLPAGTGCDFPRTLGLSTNVEEAAAELVGRTTRAIDVGYARFEDLEGNEVERRFINVLSFGVGGEVARAAATANKRLPAKLLFALLSLRELFRYQDKAVTVEEDDAPPRTIAVTNYSICNAQYHGGGIRVGPNAAIDDSWFDVTHWSDFRLRHLVWHRAKLYDGSHTTLPGTVLTRARTIKATSAQRVLVDCDGENPGRLPLTVELLPGALRFKVAPEKE